MVVFFFFLQQNSVLAEYLVSSLSQRFPVFCSIAEDKKMLDRLGMTSPVVCPGVQASLHLKGTHSPPVKRAFVSWIFT